MSLVLLVFLLAKQNSQHVIIARFELNQHGLCSFEENKHYQLQESSRFSFLGCWLTLQPLTAANVMLNVNNNPKIIMFIYRDSLTNQDFSRLSNVISQLNHQH